MEKTRTFYEEIERTGRIIYTVRGLSMLPLLRQGRDVVVIEKPKEELKKYDVVLFHRQTGQYVLHRILKKKDGKYWIVGDNNVTGEMVSEEQILGILTSVKRGERTVKITDWDYRLYTHLWCDVYPVRFLVLRIRSFIRSGISFVKERLLG